MNLLRVLRCQSNHIKRYILSRYMNLAVYIFPNSYDKIRYHELSGEKLNYDSPKDLNQKLFWLNRFWQPPIKALCADKYRIREYLSSKGYGRLAVPLLGVWSSPEDIDFDSLPRKFVLKCNHGCGFNIICKDKQSLDIGETRRQLGAWLKHDYSKYCGERHYSKIERCIICEEYLPSLGADSIIDYKLHCFNGTPDFVLVCYDRDEMEVAKLATFDFSWHQLGYAVGEEPVNIPMPASLPEMVEYAKALSEPFPFVRVDFYDVQGQPILGELSFTPYGNVVDYYKSDILCSLGKKLILPRKYKK